MITIVVADDHRIVRQGVKALLEIEPDFTVVGEASNGNEALEMAEKFKPDILVTDLKMPGISGIDVARTIGANSLGTSVIILSMYGNEAYVLAALEAGAKAYVMKDVGFDQLAIAIREVVKGKRYLSYPLTEEAIEKYRERISG